MESSSHSKEDTQTVENYMKSINGEVIKTPFYLNVSNKDTETSKYARGFIVGVEKASDWESCKMCF